MDSSEKNENKIRQNNKIYLTLNFIIATVWLINGLYCKVLNFVPRHQEIVAKILGETYARPLTLTIGLLEIGMFLWIISGIKPRFNTIFQILIIVIMNILEVILVPDLLFWGPLNFLFAMLFVFTIYLNEFKIR